MPKIPLLILLAALVLVPWALAGQAAEESGSPAIPLGRNLRFFVRPTLMGLVPPDNNEGYGEVFVRVLQLSADGLDVRYEIKEQAKPDVDSGASTRIRRGKIHVTGLESGTGVTPPLFWPDGDWTATDGLVWLPRASYRELVANGRCPWQIDFSSGAHNQGIAELQRHLSSKSAADDGDGHELRLTLISQDHYPCWVNGERTELAAQRAVDSLGLAEYWILADETNPLLLKLSFIPPALEAAADDHSPQELDVLEAGIGCAVVEIDF
jgi:hypothetical protein